MSTGDEGRLLDALRAAAREDRDEDRALARFDALASPELDADERARLEEEAGHTEEGAEIAALLAPIGAAGRRRMVEAARAAMADHGEPAPPAHEPARAVTDERGEAARSEPERPAADATHAVTDERRGLNRGVRGIAAHGSRSRRRVRSLVAAGAAVLAVAAGVALFVKERRASPDLPPYEVSLAGGVSDTRGPDDAPRTLAPGQPVRVRLRPERAVDGAVLAVAALQQDGRIVRLDGSVQMLEGGALALHVLVPEPPQIRPGPADLLILIGAPDAVPERVDAGDLLGERGRRVVRMPVVIGGP